MTKREITMFKALQSTGHGDVLIGYLEELCNNLCDIRLMPNAGLEDQKARLIAATLVQDKVIKVLKMKNPEKDVTLSDYE